MISSEEAKVLLNINCLTNNVIDIEIHHCLGRILAEDVASPSDYPPFNQSAVDGYAIRHKDKNTELIVKGTISAGTEIDQFDDDPLSTLRIFTGAECPDFYDTIVMQEFVEANNNKIRISDNHVHFGQHLRKRGEQIIKGAIALKKGNKMTPAAVGYLQSLGIKKVCVFANPKIKILTTGNEFAQDIAELEQGKIFESNGLMLQSALKSNGMDATSILVEDSITALRHAIFDAAKDLNDVILISGGVSVGDYDFTKPALQEEGYEIIFHGIQQKPGKPFLFAKNKKGTIVFGLPGNPKSALTCFYIYILPFLYGQLGLDYDKWIQLPSQSSYSKKSDGKVHFLCGQIGDQGVEISEFQASHFLKGFALSNALIEIPQETTQVNKGDLLKVKLI